VSEKIVVPSKRVPCLIISPTLDMRDSRILDFVVLRTKSYQKLPDATAEQVRARRRPWAYPLPAAPGADLEERWVDFTSADSFPKVYLEQARWSPITSLDANGWARVFKHYSSWLTRDFSGKG
jgi:hypothetical protein